jgi:hypothetical protein
VNLNSSTTIPGTLTLTNGSLKLNSYGLTVGTSATQPGGIVRTSGFVSGPGNLIRWFPTTNVTLGSDSGLFPFGVNGDNRFFWVGGAPSTAGTVSVSYTDASGTTNYGSPFSDNGITVDHRMNSNWNASTGSGLIGNNFSIKAQAKNLPYMNNVANLRLGGQTGLAPGTAVNGSGTTSMSEATRTGLTATNLSNMFFLASNSVNPLPVALSELTAQVSNGHAVLRWNTWSEQNNFGFAVETSEDGRAFRQIGFVKGQGNSAIKMSYYFDDNSYQGGSRYYRLRQADLDGSVTYSNIASIQPNEMQSTLRLAPNPVQAILTTTYDGIESDEIDIKIFDMSGGQTGENIKFVRNGASLSADCSSLRPGVYVLRLSTAQGVHTSRFVKE